MTDLVSMPTRIIPYLRMTIEEIGDIEEANFAIYHLGYEWGKETVKLSGEKCEHDELKTKVVLTAIHSGITKLDVNVDDPIEIKPFDSNIDDDHFLAGYTAGIVSGLLGDHHVAKIRKGHYKVIKSDKKVKDDFSELRGIEKKSSDLTDLNFGKSYMIQDNSKDASETFQIFTQALKQDIPGLCFTRIFPSKIRDKHQEIQFPIFWMSSVEGTEDINTIKPRDFCKQAPKISSTFMKMKKGIFMLHGIEYLLSHLKFQDLLKTILEIQDITSIEDGIFILAVDPKTIKKDHLDEFEAELEYLDI